VELWALPLLVLLVPSRKQGHTQQLGHCAAGQHGACNAPQRDGFWWVWRRR
jgi:hypothetical protein